MLLKPLKIPFDVHVSCQQPLKSAATASAVGFILADSQGNRTPPGQRTAQAFALDRCTALHIDPGLI